AAPSTLRTQLTGASGHAAAMLMPDRHDPRLVNTVAEACEKIALPVKRMISRAYHDSLFMAQICPTTMIFLPCRGGVSHRPDDYCSQEQIRKGVLVLAHTLAK